MLGRDPDAAQELLHSWTAELSTRAQAAAELSERVATITASAVGADGAVRVTVAASGAVTDLQLDNRVRRMTGSELAGIIMATIARAQAGLTEQVSIAVHDTVGTDSETGRAVTDTFARRFPKPADEQPDRWERDARNGW
ncbi:YbaB/EbfC family nucleoid-associated protein [Micromonospora profundi]|uniref:YbaB/EbfC family nucleoid-associated protein n=1 Tax=Micromonospora profundi TaxID=1420889 RepID=A0AAJ6HQU9_9ACTN|nr:YbaB/EbfC family nucleoid-associated protein [Micromonospora profundi]WLS44522.1 YbaB/EbfC family nucleoid-associated protein [Micromonospora profundi]